MSHLLGEDILQWGEIRFEQAPQSHLHWHTDTEYDYWSGVSVWLGVQNVTPDSALKLMPCSDRFPRTPEDFQSSGGMSMADFACDEQVLSLLRREMPDLEPRIVQPAVHDGEFLLFKGKLWHGSQNPSDTTRVAMGLRYATPDRRVRTPFTCLHPVAAPTS